MAYFSTQQSLFGMRGERKYLNAAERARFFECTQHLPLERQLFCRMLYYTGARISEVSALTHAQIDFSDRVVIYRTLKRRRDDVYRQIPLPDQYLAALKVWIEHKENLGVSTLDTNRLWSFGTRTGSRIIKHVMDLAKVDGARASALGLRHGFAVQAVTLVPLTQVKKWMGHCHMSTTALYLEVSGIEERQWAERMWGEEE